MTVRARTSDPISLFDINLDIGGQIPFLGVQYQILRTGLPESAFTVLGAGKSTDVLFDIAELHDLTAGGVFAVLAKGAFLYAKPGSTELADDALVYQSNSLIANVDGAAAALVKSTIDKIRVRTELSSDCKGSKRNDTKAGLDGCQKLALGAAKAAESGSASKYVLENLSITTVYLWSLQVRRIFQHHFPQCSR